MDPRGRAQPGGRDDGRHLPTHYPEAVSARPKASDVARRAGVSVTAVSFVFNNNDVGNIAPATKDRILAAAEELGYTPDGIARSLRTQQTHMLGFVTDEIASSPFAGRLLAGAMDAAAARGYAVLASDSRDHRDREQEAVTELTRRKVEGVVFATMGLRAMPMLPSTRLPMLLANCLGPDDSHFSVIPDEVRAGRAAATYLTGLGHRRVTMLTGRTVSRRFPQGNISGPLRVKGFRAGMRAAGVTAGEYATTDAGWSIDTGHAAALRVLTDAAGRVLPADRRPTAVFAVNDRVATGVLLAAASLGLRVPQDLSVLGFDDQDALAAQVVPSLTTLALPHRAMGRRAVDVLVESLESGTPPPARTELLECELLVRDSVAPAPSR